MTALYHLCLDSNPWKSLQGADRVLTVSPNYSKEIQTASGGFNLQVPSVKAVSPESENPMQWLHVVKSWIKFDT